VYAHMGAKVQFEDGRGGNVRQKRGKKKKSRGKNEGGWGRSTLELEA